MCVNTCNGKGRCGCGRCPAQDRVRECGGGARRSLFRSLWTEREVRPGLRVSVLDAALREPFRFRYTKGGGYMDFGCVLQGGLQNELSSPDTGPMSLACEKGGGGMAYHREAEGVVSIPANRRTRMLHLHVDPALLRELFQEDAHGLMPCVRQVVEGGEAHGAVAQWRMGPLVLSAANDLFLALRGGGGSRVYLEGKALEILGLQCMGEKSLAGGCGASPNLGERERFFAVREELERRHASAPSLADLSAAHGMSVTKLQTGFREFFGTSVFGYLKEYRLRKARQLLDDGAMNVSEVAWAIGYTNVSHFGAAYKKRYGVLPKKYLQSKHVFHAATVSQVTAV